MAPVFNTARQLGGRIKQSSRVYPVYTLSTVSISIEMVNYNSVLCKLSV